MQFFISCFLNSVNVGSAKKSVCDFGTRKSGIPIKKEYERQEQTLVVSLALYRI